MNDSAAELAPETPASMTPAAPAPGIDIDKLTDKVYRLMLADLRREQAQRGGSRDAPNKRG